MRRETAIRLLRDHEVELRELGVEALYLFGSTAGGEAAPESDVDRFFDSARGRFILFDLMDVEHRAARILGRPVDVMTRESLHHPLGSDIEANAVAVF